MKKLITCLLLAGFMVFTASAQENADSLDYSLEGKISYKSGTTVKMEITNPGDLPVVGQEGVLSKYFETELFGGTVSGWMSIGKMKVTAVTKSQITYLLEEELSVVTENGVKKNHFVIGKEVKFEWKMPASKDEVLVGKALDAIDTDPAAALGYLHQAIVLNDRNAGAYNILGTLYDRQEIRDSAVYYFIRAYWLDSTNINYCSNLTIALDRAGFHEKASEYADKLVRLDTLNAESYHTRAQVFYFWKATSVNSMAEMKPEDKDRILSDLNRSVKLDPQNAFYYSERAFIRKESGDLTGSCEDAKMASKLGASDGEDLIRTYCP